MYQHAYLSLSILHNKNTQTATLANCTNCKVRNDAKSNGKIPFFGCSNSSSKF